ncbi:MAG: thiamine pyrophosphate-binding protein, partial [Nitrospinota bacterium]
ARFSAAEQAKAHMRTQLEASIAEVTGKLPMSPLIMLKTLAATLPPDTVIVDESLTSGTHLSHFFVRRDAKSYFGLQGGGIGWGLPAALGVRLAIPDRPVVAIVGDGSAMYTNQSLWTAAHYNLPILYIICNNGGYLILKRRLHAYQGAAAKEQKFIGFDITEPELSFVDLAHAMGVPAERVEKPEELEAAVKQALRRTGPSLIEVMLERSITPGG